MTEYTITNFILITIWSSHTKYFLIDKTNTILPAWIHVYKKASEFRAHKRRTVQLMLLKIVYYLLIQTFYTFKITSIQIYNVYTCTLYLLFEDDMAYVFEALPLDQEYPQDK